MLNWLKRRAQISCIRKNTKKVFFCFQLLLGYLLLVCTYLYQTRNVRWEFYHKFMLNWLKRRARISFQNRYPNILGHSNSPEMFLTEQSMLNQQTSHVETIKLSVFNLDGEEYSLDVPQEMTVERIKMMAIGHFFNPMEASATDSSSAEGSKVMDLSNRYRLVLTREYKTLLEEKSVSAEALWNNDELLLVERRPGDRGDRWQETVRFIPDSLPSKEQIDLQTSHIPQCHFDRQAEPATPSLDFKVALRQILLTMIEVSAHLIAADPSAAADHFALVFEHLEKRHRPRVDKASLKQLTEMGFSEARAIRALQLKRNDMQNAMEWLLEDASMKQEPPLEGAAEDELDSDVLLLSPEHRQSFFLGTGDPALRVIREFNKYVEKWFMPEPRALQYLINLGYCEEVSQRALRIACNNEKLAEEFLEGDPTMARLQQGFEREAPIMTAILDSPVVQVALSKPKTLFALMVLCETPNNVNVWLSDPETHPVVSQVLRIYHAEKHKLADLTLSPLPYTQSHPRQEQASTPVVPHNEESERTRETPFVEARSSSLSSGPSDDASSNTSSQISPSVRARAQVREVGVDSKSDGNTEVMEVD